MQDNTEFKKTEKFAVEEEQRENEWQEQYGSKINDVVREMNQLLQAATEQSRMELHDMFLDKSFFEHYKQTDAVATMYVVMQIYEREWKDHYPSTILDCGNTVEELMDYLQQMKFMLYRIDFSIDQLSEQEFITFLKKNQTSVITLETMMTTAAMRPMNLALKLEEIFIRNFMYKELFWVRNFINERWNGNHRVLIQLADLYDRTGHAQFARECVEKISETLQILYQHDEKCLLLQEDLWKFRYKDMEAVKDISHRILEDKISTDVWSMLLQDTGVESEEFYLILSNEFLDHKMIDYAIKTLETGKQRIPDNTMINGILQQCQKLMR